MGWNWLVGRRYRHQIYGPVVAVGALAEEAVLRIGTGNEHDLPVVLVCHAAPPQHPVAHREVAMGDIIAHRTPLFDGAGREVGHVMGTRAIEVTVATQAVGKDIRLVVAVVASALCAVHEFRGTVLAGRYTASRHPAHDTAKRGNGIP